MRFAYMHCPISFISLFSSSCASQVSNSTKLWLTSPLSLHHPVSYRHLPYQCLQLHLSLNPRDPNPLQSSGCFTSSSSCLLWTPAAHTSALLKMKPLILLPRDIRIPKTWHTQLLMILARPSHSIFGSGVEIVCQRESFAKPDPNMSNIMSASVLQRKCSCGFLLTFDSQDGKMSRAALS